MSTVLDRHAATAGVDLSKVTLDRPTADEVWQAIMEDARAHGVSCDQRTAKRVYDMLSGARKQPYHLDDRDLRDLHPILEVIMPDDVVTPAPGTAHAMLNERLLDDSTTRTFVHTRTGPRLENCTVMVQVRRL